MANVIKLHQGLDINLKGKAVPEIVSVDKAGEYALIPDDFPGITPKVVVKEEEEVLAGSPLFVNKSNPEIKFVSPVSGTVMKIERGERRKILKIIVKSSQQQSYVRYGKKEVAKLSADEVKTALMEAGIFPFIKQRPYDIVANPDITPKAIFISAFDSKPLAPDFEFVLKGEEANFQTGLDALAKIAKTHLSISSKQQAPALTQARNVMIHTFEGAHPAGNAGVQIHHIDPINKGEVVWTIAAADVIFIGRMFNEGHIDFTRVIALTGSEVKRPAYYKISVGASLSNLFERNVETHRNLRYISGNVLTGRKIYPDGFLGAFDTQVTVIPEGDETHEFLGFIMPRINQFSVNHSYFNWILDPLKKKSYVLDSRIKGGKRNMIMSNEYDRVLPMDILPEYLIKAILAEDIDKMEQLGIYEVAPEDFALCEFVCSSKQELQRIVRMGLDKLRVEMM